MWYSSNLDTPAIFLNILISVACNLDFSLSGRTHTLVLGLPLLQTLLPNFSTLIHLLHCPHCLHCHSNSSFHLTPIFPSSPNFSPRYTVSLTFSQHLFSINLYVTLCWNPTEDHCVRHTPINFQFVLFHCLVQILNILL